MAYQSPLHIIKSISQEEEFEVNNTNLIRLRKRLLAELNLSGEATIIINGKTYSKDEIIKTIDHLLDSPDLELHEVIFNNSFLLRFLEDETLTLNPVLYRDLNVDWSTKQKLNQLIYERFIIQFKKGISTRTFTQSQQAIALFEFLPEDLKQICFDEVHRSLFTLHNFLNEIEHTIALDKKDDIRFLSFDSLSSFLNELNEEFEEIKYEIVNRMINIVVAYHNLKKHDKDLTKGISTTLVKIKCDPAQEKLIKSNHRVFVAGEDSSTDWSYLRYIVVAVVILINVLRACSKDQSPRVDNLTFINNTNAILAEIANKRNQKSLEDELSAYRTEIFNHSAMAERGSIGVVDEGVDINTGTNPFLHSFKQIVDSVEQRLNQNVKFENKTAYDLIVMRYDSTKTNIQAKYIKVNEATDFAFDKQSRFMFYFGNKLKRPPFFPDGSLSSLSRHEYFFDTPSVTSELLNANYCLDLGKKTGKKKSKKPPLFTLDSEFIISVKGRYTSNGISLNRIYE